MTEQHDQKETLNGLSAKNGEVYHHQGGNMPEHSKHDEQVLEQRLVDNYWRANISLLVKLLLIWFVVSFGFGIILVEQLNRISLFGYPFGFWWAQQGSIYVFVGLIFFYVVRMKKIERQYGVDDDE